MGTEAQLSVLVPVEMTGTILTSSNVPETDYAAWSSGTTYAKGDRVIVVADHRIYESLQASNTNHSPSDINNRTGTAPWWLDYAPTNRWAMFDGEVSTQTAIATPLTVVIKPGGINSIYIGGIEADTYNIVAKETTGGATVWSASGTLENSFPPDYYEYFFSPFRQQEDYLAFDLPPYTAMEITVTLAKSSGTVKCGILTVGDLRPLGYTQYGAKATPKTYSYIKTDPDFGTTSIVKRKKAKDLTMSASLTADESSYVVDTVNSLLDVPCVWIASSDLSLSGWRTFGLGNGEVSYDQWQDCTLTINVKGMI